MQGCGVLAMNRRNPNDEQADYEQAQREAVARAYDQYPAMREEDEQRAFEQAEEQR